MAINIKMNKIIGGKTEESEGNSSHMTFFQCLRYNNHKLYFQ